LHQLVLALPFWPWPAQRLLDSYCSTDCIPSCSPFRSQSSHSTATCAHTQLSPTAAAAVGHAAAVAAAASGGSLPSPRSHPADLSALANAQQQAANTSGTDVGHQGLGAQSL
jgi:hypothetical protein